MGADFIRKAAKGFKRAWDHGRLRLATADLFTRAPSCGGRTIAGEIVGDSPVEPGQWLTVERSGEGLLGRRGLAPILRFDHPPSDVLRAVDASCGVATGRIEQVHGVARVAEVSLC